MQFSSPDFTARGMITGKYLCETHEHGWWWIFDRKFCNIWIRDYTCNTYISSYLLLFLFFSVAKDIN